jgi:hypothetical protein
MTLFDFALSDASMVVSMTLETKVRESRLLRLQSNINTAMKAKRDATKAAIRFHTRWVSFLLKATPQTLRRVACEIAILEEENACFRDGAIFRLLRHQLEFVVQDIAGTGWCVARAHRDSRGRKRRGQSRPPVRIDHRLQSELRNRLLPHVEHEPAGSAPR